VTINVVALGYIGFAAIRPADWEPFAEDILGTPVACDPETGVRYLRMDDRHHRIAIVPGESDELAYLGWEVASERHLTQATAALEQAGVEYRPGTPEECRARRVVALVACQDPAGNQLELFFGSLNEGQPLLRPARPMSGFVTGPLGAGHAVIRVADVQSCVAFYTEVLGFRVTDVSPGRMVFLRCNARHHSIAFMAGQDRPGLQHFMCEVRSIDDVGTAFDLCQQRAVPIVASLGRHANDEMVSFYMRTPSGFNLEYGWGGRIVDEASWTVSHYGQASIWGHAGLGSRPRPAAGS